MLASEALAQVEQILDDVGLVHADSAHALRALNRAHHAVAIRYTLLRETQPLILQPATALYRLTDLFPRLVRLLSVDLDGIGPLWSIPFDALRYGDLQWFTRPATLAHPPQWSYALGLSWVGIYPVPIVTATATVTSVVVPEDLASVQSALVLPEAWWPHVIDTTAGMLMLASEKAYEPGLRYLAMGLGLKDVPTAA